MDNFWLQKGLRLTSEQEGHILSARRTLLARLNIVSSQRRTIISRLGLETLHNGRVRLAISLAVPSYTQLDHSLQ